MVWGDGNMYLKREQAGNMTPKKLGNGDTQYIYIYIYMKIILKL